MARELLDFRERIAELRQSAKFVVATFLAAGIPLSVTASLIQERVAQKTEQKRSEGASLTGCVDQQEGQYVLVNDHDLKVITNLDAVGFPIEGFAKYMGQKVTVRGTSTSSGARPVFKVRRIETISETCAPQATQEGKK